MKKLFESQLHRAGGMLMLMAVALMSLPLLHSCDLDDDSGYDDYSRRVPNAIVTVKTDADSHVYLQLDDSTTLYPENLTASPYGGKEVRAFVNFTEKRENASKYSRTVYVNWMDSVLTKPMMPSRGDDNDAAYGNDPVEILKGFPTVCEDGYLTLAIGTRWGMDGTRHLVNLLYGVNPDDPYELELRQNAYGDTEGKYAYTTVAFSLKNLPSTGGKTVKLKVKFLSFKGEKTAEFDFKN